MNWQDKIELPNDKDYNKFLDNIAKQSENKFKTNDMNQNKTDKQLIREGKYLEALGDNYVNLSIEIMIFKDGVYNRNLKDKDGEDVWCYDKDEAREITKDINLEPNEHFMFWNCNNWM